MRRVRKAVIMNPSAPSSRYGTTRNFPGSTARTAINSPWIPARILRGLATVVRTSSRIPASSQCSSVICTQRSEVSRIGMPFSDCIIEVVKTSYDLFEDTLFPHRFVNLLKIFKRIVHLSGFPSRPSPN